MFASGRTLSLVVLLLTSIVARGQQAVSETQAIDRVQIAARIADYDWSITILKLGLRQNWDADRYAKVLERQNRASSRQVRHFACVPRSSLQPREIWDEQLPFAVDVLKALEQCQGQRKLFVSMLNRPATANSQGK